jgi:hypothetical protein
MAALLLRFRSEQFVDRLYCVGRARVRRLIELARQLLAFIYPGERRLQSLHVVPAAKGFELCFSATQCTPRLLQVPARIAEIHAVKSETSIEHGAARREQIVPQLGRFDPAGKIGRPGGTPEPAGKEHDDQRDKQSENELCLVQSKALGVETGRGGCPEELDQLGIFREVARELSRNCGGFGHVPFTHQHLPEREFGFHADEKL